MGRRAHTGPHTPALFVGSCFLLFETTWDKHGTGRLRPQGHARSPNLGDSVCAPVYFLPRLSPSSGLSTPPAPSLSSVFPQLLCLPPSQPLAPAVLYISPRRLSPLPLLTGLSLHLPSLLHQPPQQLPSPPDCPLFILWSRSPTLSPSLSLSTCPSPSPRLNPQSPFHSYFWLHPPAAPPRPSLIPCLCPLALCSSPTRYLETNKLSSLGGEGTLGWAWLPWCR